MIVIIDAYNLLKQVSRTVEVTDGERNSFIILLQKYAHIKKLDLVLVFDGGLHGWQSHTAYKGLTVVYSGMHASADDYIQEYIQEYSAKDLLLISSDHELNRAASAYDVPSMNVIDFYRLVQEAVYKDRQQRVNPVSKDAPLIKTTQTRNDELEAVMNAASKKMPNKDTTPVSDERDSSGKKLTKQERKLFHKLKKL